MEIETVKNRKFSGEEVEVFGKMSVDEIREKYIWLTS